MNGKPITPNRQSLLRFLASFVSSKRAYVASIGLVSAMTLATQATADSRDSVQKVGRWLGVGWGDGYHSCKDSGCRPCADLPPQSYTAQLPKPKVSLGNCGPVYPPATGLPKIPHSPRIQKPRVLPGPASSDLPCDQVQIGCDSPIDDTPSGMGIVITGESTSSESMTEMPSYAVPLMTGKNNPVETVPTHPRAASPNPGTSSTPVQETLKPVAPSTNTPSATSPSVSKPSAEESLSLPLIDGREESSPSDHSAASSLTPPNATGPVQRLPAVKRMPPVNVPEASGTQRKPIANGDSALEIDVDSHLLDEDSFDATGSQNNSSPTRLPVAVPRAMFNEPQTRVFQHNEDETGVIATRLPEVQSNPFFATQAGQRHEATEPEQVRIATRPDTGRNWNPIRQPD